MQYYSDHLFSNEFHDPAVFYNHVHKYDLHTIHGRCLIKFLKN